MLFRAAGRVRAWERGEVLIRQGGRADSVVLIIGGLTKITAESANGYTSVLALRGPANCSGRCLASTVRNGRRP